MSHKFTIIVEGREFRVDSERYARESEVMRALMGESFIESRSKCANLHDVSLEDWEVFHDYFDGNEVLGPQNAETVYYIADRFGFDRAKSEVESLLLKDRQIVSEWDEFAIRMLNFINQCKDRRSRMLREKLIDVLEKNQVNVGKSIQEGRVMYRQQ
ncbi:hypothetical protein PENTCL1PPCAC_29682 [Pristionchus entomophagus]|uniref:BTB domain-containing protein n=1 Tax=Pristionchus entomophagus TaxID=358040 RepID=A0AAV5UMX1_9BILA|nr:hypothetical protein PENTCL1PPCAC_29682 [Pristionchus entomophagus]